MIDKKFAVIVLALMLLLLIDGVSGQAPKVEYQPDSYSIIQYTPVVEDLQASIIFKIQEKVVGQMNFIEEPAILPQNTLATGTPQMIIGYYYYSRYKDIVAMLDGYEQIKISLDNTNKVVTIEVIS